MRGRRWKKDKKRKNDPQKHKETCLLHSRTIFNISFKPNHRLKIRFEVLFLPAAVTRIIFVDVDGVLNVGIYDAGRRRVLECFGCFYFCDDSS